MVAEVVIAASGARLVRYIDEIRVSEYNNDWHTSDDDDVSLGVLIGDSWYRRSSLP